MLWNFFKISIRNLLKNKLFTLINILGLAIGLTASLCILEYVIFEFSYDDFHSNKNEIYRIVNDRYEGKELIQHGTITYSAIGPFMKKRIAEVVENCRLMPFFKPVFTYQDQIATKYQGYWADQSFLSMFTFPLKYGDQKSALLDKNSVLITESFAKSFFNMSQISLEDIPGKRIAVGVEKIPLIITGILENIPANSHLKFDFLISYNLLIDLWETADQNWESSDFWHYVKMTPEANEKTVEEKMQELGDEYLQGDQVTGTFEKFYLQPLKDARLYSDFEYEIGNTANGKTVWALFALSIFIMIVAWINFINLSTARSTERAREVGIRKVIGANKGQLIRQFLLESVIINLMAIILTFTLLQIGQPYFNFLIQENLSVDILMGSTYGGWIVPLLICVTILFGIFLSGIYPAYVLSSYQPAVILKGTFNKLTGSLSLRRGMVIFQFLITILFIAGTTTIFRQVKFMQQKELGINIDQILIVEGPRMTNWDSTFINRTQNLINELSHHSTILGGTSSENIPGQRTGRIFNVKPLHTGGENTYMLGRLRVDYHFMDIYNASIIAGRNFNAQDHNTDYRLVDKVIINEEAVNYLNLGTPAEAIGKELEFWERKWTIIGVIKNFNQQPLYQPMEAFIYLPFYDPENFLSFRISTLNINETILTIKNAYISFFPGNAFDYYFLNEEFDKAYQKDRLFGKVFGIFSILTMMIAGLGLFALASCTMTQRTKEIGIRKVMGASITSISILLTKDFLILILIASLIAIPLSYYGIHLWLQQYAYQIQIDPWLFLLPILMILFLTGISLVFQTLKTALNNPIESLRYE